MPLLFSYGSLQQDDVQRATVGRPVGGQRDELVRFEQSSVEIHDPAVVAALGKTHHANVTYNGDEDSRVSGMLLDVTDAELAKIDAYEAAFFYQRVAAMLASGKQTWVYVHASSASS
jgi:gamma-glutamylcyclotransferase (GGCT)/AIG2-like uncharacterized protein YtfP